MESAKICQKEQGPLTDCQVTDDHIVQQKLIKVVKESPVGSRFKINNKVFRI